MGWSEESRSQLSRTAIGRWLLRRNVTEQELDRRLRQPVRRFVIYTCSLSASFGTFWLISRLIPVPVLRYIAGALAAFWTLKLWALIVQLLIWEIGAPAPDSKE